MEHEPWQKQGSLAEFDANKHQNIDQDANGRKNTEQNDN